MTKVFIHHVGKPGADRDFPRTVFSPVDISTVERYLGDDQADQPIVAELGKVFPNGTFNVWGVPEGARIVINNLRSGDYVLLIGEIEQLSSGVFDGEISVLGEVRLFPKVVLPHLSQALWGEAHFPYIFFFETEELTGFTWQQLVTDLSYAQNYSPQGHFLSINNERLAAQGGTEEYIAQLRQRYENKTVTFSIAQKELNSDTEEERNVSTEDFVRARLALRSKLKEAPELTDDRDRKLQLISKPARSLAFKSDIRDLYDNRCAICGMALVSPKGHPEVQSAHIYPRSENGSDDPRNGLALCGIHHWAFDKGWIALNDNYQILVHSGLPSDIDYDVIRNYTGKTIRLPDDRTAAPAKIYLAAHRRLHGIE